jgi:hypothetical protein
MRRLYERISDLVDDLYQRDAFLYGRAYVSLAEL